MPAYFYKAKDKSGTPVEGVIEADTTETVAGILLAKKLTILDISLQPQTNALAKINSLFGKKVPIKELVIFFRQMAVMLGANMPLVKSLRILAKQTKHEHFYAVISGLADEVDGGSALSSAMGFYQDVFSKFFINIIRSGETSGRLAEVMNYLADQKEKDYDLESRVKGAMLYPAFIVVVLLVVGIIVMTFVVPNITAVLIESGATLPFITKALINGSSFLRNYWWLVMMIVAFVLVAFMYEIKTPAGRAVMDEFKMKIPIFGRIFRNIYLVRICRSFATLVKGGVPIASALDIVKDVVDNAVYEKVLAEAVRSVEEGNQISESLLASPHIPSIMGQMIAVGEESGKLEEVLERVAEFYSRETDNMVRNLSNLIEPFIMVFLGLAVGLFVAAVIMPMWQLSSSF